MGPGSGHGPGPTRRAVLVALLAGAAAPAARAEAPARVPRPPRRPDGGAPRGPTGEEIVAAARLGGQVGFLAVDSASGAVVEARAPGEALPPASTAKAVTALYALDRLGPGFRFATRLIASGPVAGGVVAGDLVLAGGGDPTLDTDALAGMAEALQLAGVTQVSGRFLFDDGALPRLASIDPDQPVQAGYNPAIAGLNLNFNRLHFEWKRGAGGWDLALDARSERFVPAVGMARMRVVDRAAPVYTFAAEGGRDSWTVASAALGKGGSRWLPVRQPGAYAADVFRTLARARGIGLPAPRPGTAPPGGTVLVGHQSPPLSQILAEMLRFSTNLTAEAVGLTASGPAARSLSGSGREMSVWARARFGRAGRHADHSGLEADSRVAPADLVAALAGARAGPLRGMMRDFPLVDAEGREVADSGVRVAAKTGTLNFVSGLAGYLTTAGGRDIAFAILAADPARRDAVPIDDREAPPGLKDWLRRARRMQSQLLHRWSQGPA